MADRPPPGIERRRGAGPWTESLRLPDGRDVVLRPIDPRDWRALREGFAVLSPEEVRMRFLHPLNELGEEQARELANVDRRRGFALVVAEPAPPGEGLVGAVVRASLDTEGRGAEFALIVARPLARQGLGTLLMRRLIEWARRRRLDRLYGHVLDENTAMLRLCERLGFKRRPVPGEPGLQRVELELRRG